MNSFGESVKDPIQPHGFEYHLYTDVSPNAACVSLPNSQLVYTNKTPDISYRIKQTKRIEQSLPNRIEHVQTLDL